MRSEIRKPIWIISEREIKDKLSELKDFDTDIYEYLLNKIEFNRFQRLKKNAIQTIKRYLARIKGYQEATIKEYPKRFMEEYQKRVSVKELIDIINSPSDKKKILYVTVLPFNLVRQSIYLRKAGYETIILMSATPHADFAERYFDIVYVYHSIYTLAYILKESKPYLIHVLGTGASSYLGILARFLSKSKIVYNFYDISSTAILKEYLVFLRGKEEAELEFFSERFACERCNGLIIGYSPEAHEILKNRYHITAPMLEFHSYVCDEFISDDNSKYSNMDGNIHLVYGGTVASSHLPEKIFGDIQLHSLIEKLAKQGIYFDIYTPPYASPLRKGHQFDDYIVLSETNPLFNFRKGLLPDEVTSEFSKYDFGAMINLFDRGTCLEEHNRTRLPNKFFTYLEAGLPILISEELQYVAKLVKEYGIGIVVSQKDLDNLPEIINSYDREKLNANVKKAREELSMKKHIGRLIDFYEQVMQNE